MRAATQPTHAAAALLAVLAGLGCSDNFDKQSHIDSLRVLGVQAEPAELILTDGGTLPRATLTALAISPTGAPATARFALCLVQGATIAADTDCPGDAGVALPDAGPVAATLDLGDPALAAAALALLSSQGADAGAGGAAALAQGIPLVVGFDARAPAGGYPDGGPPASPGLDVQRVLGATTITVRTADPASPVNRNPALTDVLVQPQGADGGAPFTLRADGSSVLAAGVKVTLAPVPAADAKEATQGGLEKLTFSFYATDGTLDSLRSTDTTATGQPGNPNDDYTPPGYPATVRLWVVVRDGRGGVGWIERAFQVR